MSSFDLYATSYVRCLFSVLFLVQFVFGCFAFAFSFQYSGVLVFSSLFQTYQENLPCQTLDAILWLLFISFCVSQVHFCMQIKMKDLHQSPPNYSLAWYFAPCLVKPCALSDQYSTAPVPKTVSSVSWFQISVYDITTCHLDSLLGGHLLTLLVCLCVYD